MKRNRWTVLFAKPDNLKYDKKSLDHPDVQDFLQSKPTFGFKSGNSPPIIKELIDFEEDLWKLIKNLEFRDNSCKTQNEWAKDVEKMKESNKIIVAGDKSTSYYLFEQDDYQKLLRDKVTTTYSRCDSNEVDESDKKAAVLAERLGLENRIEKFTPAPCFLTLKDHKKNFEINKPTRPINPAKPQIGKISKSILEGMVQEIQIKLNINQWRSTQDVLAWFEGIENKNKYNFICFDVANFYPSITEKLLKKTLKWARKYSIISEFDFKMINLSRESYLFNNGTPWIKTGEKGKFDVPMGAYDGAEVCELIGLFMLYKITNPDKYTKKAIMPAESIGLYRDDGLAIIRDNNRNIQKIKENIAKAFKEEDLEIEFVGSSNMKQTNYLDVTLDLEKMEYGPYRKPENKIKFINTKSNHPPLVIKQIKPNVQHRLSTLSSSKEIFDEAKAPYEEALRKSGHMDKKEKLVYQPKASKKKKKSRKRYRKVTWYNPPYNKNVKTCFAREFLKLISKHFPKGTELGKILNRSTVKVSYCTTRNIAKHISSHNKKLLAEKVTVPAKTCNCPKTRICPFEKNCLKNGVYRAEVTSNPGTSNEKVMKYIGATSRTFKDRMTEHKGDIKNRKENGGTTLSTYTWKLKDSKIPFNISWHIQARGFPRGPGAKHCDLCVTEKLHILKAEPKTSLNSRRELLGKCRHRDKHLLMKCLS